MDRGFGAKPKLFAIENGYLRNTVASEVPGAAGQDGEKRTCVVNAAAAGT